MRGAFITFEGIDGCGKTTQARLLAERLRAELPVGHALVETREPGGTAIGRGLRQVLLDPANEAFSADCELLLFLADRVQHLEELIAPALGRGETVICDRFHDSTVAFQQYGRGLDFAPYDAVVEAKIAPTAPDMTFWLDVEPEEAWRRISGRRAGPEESLEGARLDGEEQAFHLRVRIGYERLHEAHAGRIIRVDAAPGIGQIAEAVWNNLADRFHVL